MLKEKEDSLFQMYDNESGTYAQALAFVNGEWDREVVPRLPDNIAEMASRLGAFERARKIRSSTDLLRGLLAYVSGNASLQNLGAWALLINLADVSASDWCKRLYRARRWLEWLMTELIGQPASGKQDPVDASHGYRVWLVDGTHVGQEGGTGDDWRLHICYDWLAGRLISRSVTDKQAAEGFWHVPNAPRTIRVADRAYGYRDELLECSDGNQEAVVRICSSTFPCLDADETPFDIEGWLGEDGGSRRSRWVWITSSGRRETSGKIPVQMHAQRISGAALQREREAAKRRANKQGHALSKTTEQECEWILIATTLSERWSVEEVLLLYRARWRDPAALQTDAHPWPISSDSQPEHKKALKLISRRGRVLWLLQEEVQHDLREEFASQASQEIWQEDEEPLSRWTMTQLSLSLLLLEIRGVWTRPSLARVSCTTQAVLLSQQSTSNRISKRSCVSV